MWLDHRGAGRVRCGSLFFSGRCSDQLCASSVLYGRGHKSRSRIGRSVLGAVDSERVQLSWLAFADVGRFLCTQSAE